MRLNNLNFFEPLVRLVTTAGTPVRLSQYLVDTSVAFVYSAGSNDTITDSNSGFLTAGFAVGDLLTISGSTSNDSTKGYKITTVTAGTLTIDFEGTLTSEIAGDTVTLETTKGFEIPDGVKIVIRALPTNTGAIYIGPTSARAVSTATGYFRNCTLEANQTLGLELKNLKNLWIDSAVSGEGVEILFEK